MFFLFILFIVPFLYYSHECGVYPPKNASYCFNHFENPDNKICCMLTDRQTNNSFCKFCFKLVRFTSTYAGRWIDGNMFNFPPLE